MIISVDQIFISFIDKLEHSLLLFVEDFCYLMDSLHL